jgi:hypothetical protein
MTRAAIVEVSKPRNRLKQLPIAFFALRKWHTFAERKAYLWRRIAKPAHHLRQTPMFC